MINRVKKYFNGSNSDLRKRSVHILYIVFLIIILSFIPNSFKEHLLDTKTEITTLNKKSISSSNRELALFSEFIRQDPELYQDLKFRAIEMERLKDQCNQYISRLQNKYYSADKKNNVFSKKGISWSSSELDSLLHIINLYRSGLIELTDYQGTSEIDSILHIKRFIQDTEGSIVSLDDYLKSSTYAGSTYLQWLEIKINAAYNVALNRLEADILRTYNDSKKYEKIKLPNITNNERLTDFFRSAESIEPSTNRIAKSSEHDNITINAQHKSTLTVNDLIHYKVSLNNNSSDKLSIRVDHLDGDQYFSMNSSGDFIFVPQTSGIYSFTFSKNDEVVRDQVYVEEVENAVVVNNIQSLFKGVQNEIQISDQLMKFSPAINVETNNGSWRYVAGKLFIQPASSGNASIKIYADMAYGKILLIDGTYDVYEKPLPTFSLNGTLNGGGISGAADFKVLLLNDNPGLDQFYTKSFVITLISRQDRINQQSFFVRGEELDQKVISSIAKLHKGDKILCDEIEIRSSTGQIFKLDPYVVNVE